MIDKEKHKLKDLTEVQAYSNGIKVFYRTIFLVILIISIVLGGLIYILKP